MEIEISDYIYKKVVKFAHDRIEGSKRLYSYRGESKVDKMIDDIITGTLGEWAIYKVLKESGFKVNKPDMKIYEKRRKSFKADLLADERNVHVKSQSHVSASMYGNSWLLQKSDKIVANPTSEDYFAFTEVEGRKVNILGFVKAIDLSEQDLYGECKVPFFRKTKVALYLNDIKKYVKMEI